MTAIAPPTDRLQSDFLEGAQFAVCPMIAEQWDSGKKKRNGLRMKYQYLTSSVSRSFLFFCFFRQSLVSVAGCLSSVWLAVAGFSGRIHSTPFEEDSARNGSAARPCRCLQSHTLPLHPCIGNGRLTGLTSAIP